MKFDICRTLILAVVIMGAGCGNLTEPSSFSFATQSNVPTATVISSNVVTIKGNQFPAPISFANASSASYSQYSINGGAFTAGALGDQLSPGNTLQLQQTTASTPNTARTTTINVGGLIATFTTVTGNSGGTVTISDSSGTVTISSLTAILSQGKSAVNFTINASTNNTSLNARSVAFTLQAISNTGAVVAQYAVSSTTPAQIAAGGPIVSAIFPVGATPVALPSTTSTLPAGLPAAINGNPPSTVAYWSQIISFWQIVPGTLTFVQ